MHCNEVNYGKASKSDEANRTRHPQAYKDEALALAERIWGDRGSRTVGLHPSQLYGGRARKRRTQLSGEYEQLIAEENACLKRLLAEQTEELAIVKKASAYFAKSLK